MVQTLSNMMPLGTQAPDFKLLDTVSEQHKQLQELKGDKATLIMFICNHCPFVKHIQEELVNIGSEYTKKGIGVIAISANDVASYPEDSPSNMKLVAESLGYCFPYLYDETQQVAKQYDATCTPDFFLFDAKLKCVYRGQLDDSRPGNNLPVNGSDLRDAMDRILTNRQVSDSQKPSVGCNIKWK